METRLDGDELSKESFAICFWEALLKHSSGHRPKHPHDYMETRLDRDDLSQKSFAIGFLKALKHSLGIAIKIIMTK